MTNASVLQRAWVPLMFTVFVTDSNQITLADTLAFYQRVNPQQIFTDYLYPGSRGEMDGVPRMLVEQLVAKQNNLTQVSLSEFFDRQQFNTCLRGKLAVSADGYLLPCPAMFDKQVGDVRAGGLKALIADRALEAYWTFSKDKVHLCRGCEFRYACLDCRALHIRTTGRDDGLAYCAYDPDAGEWRDPTSVSFPLVQENVNGQTSDSCRTSQQAI